jgi:hypothetical protein
MPETSAPMDLLDVLIGDASRKCGDGCRNGQAEAKPRASLGWRTLERHHRAARGVLRRGRSEFQMA